MRNRLVQNEWLWPLSEVIQGHVNFCVINISKPTGVGTRTRLYMGNAERGRGAQIIFPLLGKIIYMRPLGSPHTKPLTNFEVSSSNSFEDMFDRMPKIVRVAWPRPRPLLGKFFVHPLGIPHIGLQSRVPNLKFLAQVVLEIVTRNGWHDLEQPLNKGEGHSFWYQSISHRPIRLPIGWQ